MGNGTSVSNKRSRFQTARQSKVDGTPAWGWSPPRIARAKEQVQTGLAELRLRDALEARARERAQRVQSDLQAARLLQQRGHTLCEQGESSEGLHSLARSLQQLQEIQGPDLGGDLRQQAGELEHAVRMDLALFAREIPQLRGVLSHRGIVRAVAFSPDSHLAMTGGDGFGAWVWDATKGEPLGEPLPHPDEVRAVEFGADGKSVLTAGSDRGRGRARLWDLATRRPLGPLLEFPSPVLSAALHPDGKTVLVGRADGAAQLWDGATGRPLGAALSHPEPVNAVAFSGDGSYFATGCGGAYIQGHARRWSTRTSEPAGPLLDGGYIASVTFHPDGQSILTGGADYKARFWDPASGGEKRPALPHVSNLSAVTFSPDGRQALLAGSDGTARLWDLATGTPIGGPIRHAGGVYAAKFSPDGKSLLTGVEDGTARLWRVAPGLKIKQALQTESDVRAASYSRDGRTIVAGDLGGSVSIWDVATGKLTPVIGDLAPVWRSRDFRRSPTARPIPSPSTDSRSGVVSPFHHDRPGIASAGQQLHRVDPQARLLLQASVVGIAARPQLGLDPREVALQTAL